MTLCQQNEMIIGIDLGTSNSVMAYVNHKQEAEIIVNKEGKRLTPSCVLSESDGSFSVGDYAKLNRLVEPGNYVDFIKHEIGRPEFSFFFENGGMYSPEFLSSVILKKMKTDAETYLQQPVTGVIITVPAYFDEAQRKATKDAGTIAGLRVLQLVNEPTAAALAHYHKTQEKKGLLAVYDLGGGTFDFSLVQLDQDQVNVLATDGIRRAGGYDIDKAIFDDVMTFVMDEADLDLFDDDHLHLIQDLSDRIEQAKILLATRQEVTIPLNLPKHNLKYRLTQSQLEVHVKKLYEKTESIMTSAMHQAQVKEKDIDRVILVGGSTRLTYIRSQLLKRFTSKICQTVIADEEVALGAAYFGQYHVTDKTTLETDANKQQEKSLPLILDVSSHSLGVITLCNQSLKYINSVILKKNCKLPAKYIRHFYTVDDNQRQVKLVITEGEDEDINDVRTLGTFEIDLPPHLKKGCEVTVEIALNQEQLVVVTLSVPSIYRHAKKISFLREDNLSDQEIQASKDLMSNTRVY